MAATGCAHFTRHDAPERLAAAQKTLDAAAGHPVAVDIDASLGASDSVTAQFIEAYAAAILRYDPSANACSNCTTIYRVALDADALSLARGVQRIQLFRAPKGNSRPVARFVDGTLTLPLASDHGVETASAPYGVDTVIEGALERQFAGRSPTDIADKDLARYVLYQGMQLCAVTPLTAVYSRLRGNELAFARESLANGLTSPGCNGDNRIRAAWTTWFQVHAKDLDEDELRNATRSVFPPQDQPTSVELTGMPPIKYALAVFKRTLADPSSREAHVLLCTDNSRCNSPLLNYFVLEHTGARRRDLARALKSTRSPELAAFTCQIMFATRGAYQWRAEFLEIVSGEPEVWTAAMTAAFKADAAAMNDQLFDIWTKHVPLRPALLRAATAAADTDPPRRDVIRDIEHLAHAMCRSEKNTDFFTVFTATVPASSPLATEVTRNGTSCQTLQ